MPRRSPGHALATATAVACASALLLPATAVAAPAALPSSGLGLPGLPTAVLADLDTRERSVVAAAVPAAGESRRHVSLLRERAGVLTLDTVTLAAVDAAPVAALLEAQPSVVEASVAQPLHATADPGVASQWALPRLKAEQVRVAQGSTGPVVAVLDTGIARHPDLDQHVLPGYDATPVSAGVTGYPVDADGHGTHVAGIIGAVGGNGLGVEGLLANVALLPVKVLGDDDSGDTGMAAEGVLWAADHGAGVISMSLGGPAADPSLQAAIDYARGKGVTVVAAMGNDYLRGDPTSYPAAMPGVMAVGATDAADRRGAFSSTGSHISVAAPGVDIVSTYLGAGYARMSGTSMATPYAAAVVAAVHARYPSLTPDQLRAHVEATADDLGAVGFDPQFGYGLVDPLAALTTVPTPLREQLPPVPAQVSGVTVTPADGGFAVSWSPAASASPVTSYRVTATPAGGAPVQVTVTGTSATFTGLPNGVDHEVRVEAGNAGGWSPASIGVHAVPGPPPAVTPAPAPGPGTRPRGDAGAGPARTACRHAGPRAVTGTRADTGTDAGTHAGTHAGTPPRTASRGRAWASAPGTGGGARG